MAKYKNVDEAYRKSQLKEAKSKTERAKIKQAVKSVTTEATKSRTAKPSTPKVPVKSSSKMTAKERGFAKDKASRKEMKQQDTFYNKAGKKDLKEGKATGVSKANTSKSQSPSKPKVPVKPRGGVGMRGGLGSFGSGGGMRGSVNK